MDYLFILNHEKNEITVSLLFYLYKIPFIDDPFFLHQSLPPPKNPQWFQAIKGMLIEKCSDDLDGMIFDCDHCPILRILIMDLKLMKIILLTKIHICVGHSYQ